MSVKTETVPTTSFFIFFSLIGYVGSAQFWYKHQRKKKGESTIIKNFIKSNIFLLTFYLTSFHKSDIWQNKAHTHEKKCFIYNF